ncbi:hypothetical protein BD413DRAFT_465008 [Trametes elegans]|nr:hypothetical protein BD413DRAFT_465008 [Trametes elegans]
MARRPSAASVALPGSPEQSWSNGITTYGTPKLNAAGHGEPARRPAARSISSSQKLDSSINLHDIDPDDLFARHSVSEIKMVQHRLRAEADAKQEELRLMVGERYRDLLQASTSILSLAKSSKHVLEALEEMRDTVSSITPSRAPKRATTGEDKHLQALQSLSAHVKLLLDAPEHLWRLMEKKAYLNAAWLFLLARVVHRALSQDDDDQSWYAYGIDVAEQLPLVQRQWDTITPFRSQIAHRATLFLREADTTPGEVCATLLTLHLLESRPLAETLSIYLAQRTKTLSNVLVRNASSSANGQTAEPKANGKAPHRPRKVVVRETKQKAEAALNVVAHTLGAARQIFADSPSGELSTMKQALHFFQTPSDDPAHLPSELQLSTHLLLSSLPSSSHLLLLPQPIRTYKPYVDSASLSAPNLQHYLQTKLRSWFEKAIADLNEALADWFTPLDSVRDVWDVRSALLLWLKDAEGLDRLERQELESAIDTASLKQATAVWKSALDHLESSFRESVTTAANELTTNPREHALDTHPIEHLFRAPTIPSGLQTGAHGSATAAAQFSKYRSSLQQQLNGRTPLIDAALTTLEHHATEIHKDLAAMHKSLDNKSELVQKLAASYRADAETACDHICDALEAIATREDPVLSVFVYAGRIAQELSSLTGFFAQVGCSEAAKLGFCERSTSLANRVMRKWQERVVSRIVENVFGHSQTSKRSTAGAPWLQGSVLPTRPSPALTEALLLLSGDMQQLGVCLDDDHRRRQVGSTVQQFIGAFVERLERDGSEVYSDDLNILWDLSFLQQLVRSWGPDASDASQRIDASIARWREHVDAEVPSQADIITSTQEYLHKTQILLAGLLPPRPLAGSEPLPKTDKPSSLLLFGVPGAEQGFEPAVELVKPPPRFGLLLVGGAALR